MKYENFDLIEYLDDRRVPYSTHSKHTTAGHINIACPFCDDDSDHLGIDIASKASNCWRCGGKHILRIVQIIEGGCSAAEANTVISTYSKGILQSKLPTRYNQNLEEFRVPKQATSIVPDQHLKYLQRRRFDASTIEKYGLLAIVNSAEYKQRILIPVFENGVMVTFTTLDITGLQEAKYKACPTGKSPKTTKNCVYNIDNAHDKVLIVEGPTDVWRIGDGAVCTFGTAFTYMQIDVIRRKNLRAAIVMYDGEDNKKQHVTTLSQAQKLAHSLLPVIHNKNVELIEMSHGDPDSMSDEQVAELRNEIF